jgi:hypothetical protein
MSFQHDKIATVTLIGDYFTLTTQVDAPYDCPSENLDAETEYRIVSHALEFLKGYYGFDLDKAWTDYSIELRDAE